jgi:hypothetical protein
MTTFDKREEAFEKKFVIDEELKFKAEARRNRLLGLWVAEKLGKAGPDAETYAKEIVIAEVDGGDEGVYRKVTGDLAAKGVSFSEDEIRTRMTELLAAAIAQVKAGL